LEGSIIAQIVDMDKKARAEISKARQMREESLKRISSEKKEIEERLLRRAKNTIVRLNGQNMEDLARESESIKGEGGAQIQKIEAFFQENSHSLEDLIYGRCIYGSDSV
jgi:hypothetical protein